ncbi:DNA recombination protein RmuC [Caldicellulosiruptor changbaiensis]|uniref:DNA recombination protein RmuC n=1 Tax=Caldicellulosiruptor changbaiensis TaxID=1222016 RepID=A0A3T0D7U1_9FIRM|nr:DNA recombination protein RmuC [Caldicellulosiruptor changbaiensis]AZT91143.1 DNA recombination protein RmuC [Caldicellulosiruptor changbaiensis]
MEIALLLLVIILLVVNIVLVFSIKNSSFQTRAEEKFESIEKMLDKLQNLTLEQISQNRSEVQNTISSFGNLLMSMFSDFSSFQKSQFDSFSSQILNLTTTSQEKLETIRKEVDSKLSQIQEQNERKLEQIRQTVDSHLQQTLEAKLGESFKLVSERLELVHRGLGEMQALANGVGDLKRILSNVKVRGTLGEIQLGNIIDQILDTSKYERNVRIKPHTQEQVEFAIKIPSKNSNENEFIYLPIDSKFPIESYERLLEAQEKNNIDEISKFSKELENSIKQNAKTIKEKYIDPPRTTDFAIMFLPTEGLYAEVLRIPGLFEYVQREYKVIIAGPTTISAILNSLALGFKTIAIEKRTSEVWELLSAVKTEFSKFGEVLEKVKKKLLEAQDTIDTAARKTRTIERKLKNVESLSSDEAAQKVLYSDETEEEQ